MNNVPVYQVDAFTKQPFYGNPAAVCILKEEAEEAWMQKVAHEMNLSETAFVVIGKDSHSLRWFTPTSEVSLCGHATLAAAYVLWSENWVDTNNKICFETHSGTLTAQMVDEGYIELEFPAEEDEAIDDEFAVDELIKSLRIEYDSVRYLGKNRLDYLVELYSEDKVAEIAPDFRKLAELTERGVIVTSLSDDRQYDFVSRFFAPAVGVNEDPVTGSAHCNLGPYWKERLKKSDFYAYQDSDRGGELRVRVDNDKVFIAGKAVTVLRGELL